MIVTLSLFHAGGILAQSWLISDLIREKYKITQSHALPGTKLTVQGHEFLCRTYIINLFSSSWEIWREVKEILWHKKKWHSRYLRIRQSDDVQQRSKNSASNESIILGYIAYVDWGFHCKEECHIIVTFTFTQISETGATEFEIARFSWYIITSKLLVHCSYFFISDDSFVIGHLWK